MDLRFDASDFTALASDLDRAAATDLIGKIEPTLMRGAGNVMRGMREDMAASTHFKGVTDSITFDVDTFTTHARAEIGPLSRAKSPGNLANIAYFGGANGGGGTVRDPEYHLEQEAPALEKYVGDILDGLI